MNEELNNALTAFIESITMAAQKAGEFGAEQLPEVIEQLLMWSMIKSLFFLALGMLFIFFGARMLRYVMIDLKPELQKLYDEDRQKAKEEGSFSHYRYANTGVDMTDYPQFWLRLVPAPILVVAGFALINIEWLKILIAPKVWLIEYAADLIK